MYKNVKTATRPGLTESTTSQRLRSRTHPSSGPPGSSGRRRLRSAERERLRPAVVTRKPAAGQRLHRGTSSRLGRGRRRGQKVAPACQNNETAQRRQGG